MLAPLCVPREVSFIEAGVTELIKLDIDSPATSRDISLHLSRTPITENLAAQHAYAGYIAQTLENLSSYVREKIISIGVHLTGSRFEGQGLLGSADSYDPTDGNLERAFAFVDKLSSVSGLPIWLENANFYSDGVARVVGSWAHISQLCQSSKCAAILDIAHVVVEANNNGISPEVILGCVPWNHIVEFHLSGISHGRDGSMHDGHSHPVPDSVWRLLDASRLMIPDTRKSEVIFTIEHTPPLWADKSEDFLYDFIKLNNLLSKPIQIVSFAKAREKYMRGYLKYVVTGEIPLLADACTQRGFLVDELLERWLVILKEEGRRVIFNAKEVPESELHRSAILTSEFLNFAKITLNSADIK